MGLAIEDLKSGDLVLVIVDKLLEGRDGILVSIQSVGVEARLKDVVLADGINGLLEGLLEFTDLVAKSRILYRLDLVTA